MALDLATLGIKIDSTSVTPATAQLDKLTAAGAKTEAQMNALAASTTRLSRAGDSQWQGTVNRIAKIREEAAAYQSARAAIEATAVAEQQATLAATEAAAATSGLAAELMAFAPGAAFLVGVTLLTTLFDHLRTSIYGTKDAAAQAADQVERMVAGRYGALEAQAIALEKRIDELKGKRGTFNPFNPLNIGAGVFGEGHTSTADQAEMVRLTRDLASVQQALDKIHQENVDRAAEQMDRVQKQVKDVGSDIDHTWQALQGLVKTAERFKLAGKEPGALIGIDQNALVNANRITREQMDAVFGGQSSKDALRDAQALSGTIQQAVGGGLALANAFGAVDESTQRIVAGLSDAITSANTLAAALKAKDALAEVSSIVGLAGGIANLITGLFHHGPSPAEQAALQAQKDNTVAIQLLTQNVQSLSRSTTGTQDYMLRGLIQQGLFGGGTLGSGLNAVQLQQLKDAAKGYGVNTTSPTWIQQLLQALNGTELLNINGSLGAQLRNLQTGFQIGGVTDPLKQLQQELALLKPYSGPLGDPRNLIPSGNKLIFDALNGLNLGTAGGRSAGEAALLNLFNQLNTGKISTQQLGGLAPQEFLDQLQQMTAQMRSMDDATKGVVDGLKSFQDSLRLDQTLTTLSPAQQLLEARRQYQTVLNAALGGDATAAGQLPDLARQYLSADRAYNASGVTYATDFAKVLADTDAVQKLFGGQVDMAQQTLAATKAMTANTANTVDRLDASIAVLQAGFQQGLAEQKALRTQVTDLLSRMNMNLEGPALN